MQSASRSNTVMTFQQLQLMNEPQAPTLRLFVLARKRQAARASADVVLAVIIATAGIHD